METVEQIRTYEYFYWAFNRNWDVISEDTYYKVSSQSVWNQTNFRQLWNKTVACKHSVFTQ